MPRIQVTLPQQLPFSTELQIYQSHINEAGHLDNAQLLTLVSEARQRFFRSMGYTQTEVEGTGIVIADTAVQYRSEAFHGETLRFEIGTDDFNRYGCDLVYLIREKTSGREVARVKNGIVFYDYAARRICPLPAAFAARCQSGPA